MSTTRRTFMGGVAAIGALALSACGGSSSGSGSIDGTPEGKILVLTNRTDIVKTQLAKYAKQFQTKYPDVTVTFQALTDYEGDVKTRMSTEQYGDVLLIPNAVAKKDYANFFTPLGKKEDLAKKYSFTDEATVDGTVYGLATFGNANGTLYNKTVLEKAGMSAPPTSPEALIELLQKVKSNGKATPYYTNYKDGWPLGWPQNFSGSVSGSKDAFVTMASQDAPWTKGNEKYVLDSTLYDLVKAGVTEADPTTTNWENSKSLMATGKIGIMPLASWALPQMQDAARSAGVDPKVVGIMPPMFQKDGGFVSPTGGDYKMAINVHSDHKAAAKAWIDWMVNESGFYEYAGGLPTVTSDPVPASLKEFKDAGVTFVAMTPSPKMDAIDKAGEIGLSLPDNYRDLVDSARGASGKSKEEIFEALNKKWLQGRQDVA